VAFTEDANGGLGPLPAYKRGGEIDEAQARPVNSPSPCFRSGCFLHLAMSQWTTHQSYQMRSSTV